jgi:hypothetical protein
MTGYIGARCPVCNKKFAATDDIVVCPVCGAPHHRECYFQSGQCAFLEEHITGKAWRPPYEPKTEDASSAREKTCPGCGKQSPEDNIFCNHCGKRLTPEAPPQQSFFGGMPWLELDQSYYVYGGLREEETLSGELTAREYAAYVGASSAYYLPRFKSVEAGRPVIPNLSAMLFGFLFYFYRKMYLIGSVLLVLFLLGLIPSFLLLVETFPDWVDAMNMRGSLETLGFTVGTSGDIDWNLANYYSNVTRIARYINLAVALGVSLVANRLYYNQATKAIRDIRGEYAAGEAGKVTDLSGYELMLARTGGTSRLLVVVLVVGIYALLSFAMFRFILVQ